MTSAKTQLIERPPVVVIMGHVDHGKSTLLDFIRKSNVVAGEAGGITQHVAAYEVEKEYEGKTKRITFIDTPGHAAFSAIRARGANVADIAVLVVAADDGVKAQTLEALQQIREAGIPFIVAINKIDKPLADIARTQASLLEKEVYLEKLGGDIPWAAISAKNGTGVDDLLDLILFVAEIQDFKADPAVPAEGYVIEAHRDQKRGIAATLIITNGTLKSGMAVLAGRAVSPVRLMEDHRGKALKEATFSTPVQLVGFDELPDVGSEFKTFKKKGEAEAARPAPAAPRPLAAQSEDSEQFSLPVIIRADTTGSLEAIAHELIKVGDQYKRITIVQSGIGNVTEGDLKTAMSGKTQAVIIGFNVSVDPIAQDLARLQNIRIDIFDIIYKLTEKLEEVLQAKAPKRKVEQVVGRAKILKIFSSGKEGQTVGGKVTEGYLEDGGTVRVMRQLKDLGIGKIKSIQTNKQSVSRAEAGGQFGAQIAADFDISESDVLECIQTSMV